MGDEWEKLGAEVACSEIDLSECAHFLWAGLVDILIWKYTVEKSQTEIDWSDLWVRADRISCGGVLLISSGSQGNAIYLLRSI